MPYDENLLERAGTQWQFGDWESLAKINRDTLQHHPDRAKLALLAAAARLQTGNHAEAKKFIRLSQDWGISKKLISQILIAGVHNSIGRAAAIGNQQNRALQHFENAIQIGVPGGDFKLLTKARIQHQLALLRAGGGQRQPSFQFDLAKPDILQAPTFGNHLHAVLSELHETLKPRFYLEIGVGNGETLALARCKALGVDPVVQERPPFGPNVHILQTNSDDFFAQQANSWLRALPLDFVLVTGIPLVDYVLRSLIALEAHLLPTTLLAIPGIFPRTPESSTRHRAGNEWYGDIWKLPALLRANRPDLQLLELDVEPAGLLMLTGFSPNNKALVQRRPDYAEHIQCAQPAHYDILHRTDAVRLGGSHYTAFLQNIQSLKS